MTWSYEISILRGENMEFNFYSPKSEEELSILLRQVEDYRLLAGGTDVLVRMKQHAISPANLVDLQKVTSLKYIRENAGFIEIGSMTTHSDIVNSALIREKAFALAEAAGEVGAPQIRNRGTVGGNICNASPAADTVPALLALGATIEVKSKDIAVQLPLSEVFLGPSKTCLRAGEYISKITLAPLASNEGAAFIKNGNRKAQAIAVINGAAWLQVNNGVINNVRVALGAVAPTPIRLYEVEKQLINKKANTEVFEEAAEMAALHIKPISDIRGGADHRLRLAKVLVRISLETALARVKEVCKCE